MQSNKPLISGFRHIFRLAGMEGRLMVIAATQRVTGRVNDVLIAFIAIEFVRERYTEKAELSASCLELAESVKQLALQIDATCWNHWVNYESDAMNRRKNEHR
ncbi:hypothetical protein [Pantoea agglomerans]|uniref:hypothetical protein n=1 Tax=Enterobacter agglomerans TaxID=549 RepID=UPI0032089C27